jgi:hypothetical protein
MANKVYRSWIGLANQVHGLEFDELVNDTLSLQVQQVSLWLAPVRPEGKLGSYRYEQDIRDTFEDLQHMTRPILVALPSCCVS